MKTFSPPFRRARETRAGSGDPNFCQAEKNGYERCPPGWCRCSGELRKQVETRDHPWGAPESTPGPCKPPKMTKEELQKALEDAQNNRKAARGDVITAIQTLVAKAKAAPLAVDEAERIAELEEWAEVLSREP